MKKKHVNYAVGIAICLTMALSPVALYHTVKAGVTGLEGRVFTTETPAQYAEEFSGGQTGTEPAADEIFITDGQLEAFKQMGLRELQDLGLEVRDTFRFIGCSPTLSDDSGLSLLLIWSNTDDPNQYISVGFTGADIETGTGMLQYIQAYECYDVSLLGGFINTGESQFREKLISIRENYETSAFIIWLYNGENAHPDTQVTIYWRDPLEREIMTNLSITDAYPDLFEYSIAFDNADLIKQEGEIVRMFRNGAYASPQRMFRPIEDFTADEMEVMEKAARVYAEDMGIYAGDILTATGYNFGADAGGVRFEFDSEGKNGYDHPVIINVTRTGTVVGYAISF